jgi:hypothetical protein
MYYNDRRVLLTECSMHQIGYWAAEIGPALIKEIEVIQVKKRSLLKIN